MPEQKPNKLKEFFKESFKESFKKSTADRKKAKEEGTGLWDTLKKGGPGKK